MAEKKKSSQQDGIPDETGEKKPRGRKKTVVKASTGAWWKSTPVLAEEETSKPEEISQEPAPVKEPEQTKEPALTGKPEKTEEAALAKEDAPENGATPEPVFGESTESGDKGRAKRIRRPRKKRSMAKKDPAGETDEARRCETVGDDEQNLEIASEESAEEGDFSPAETAENAESTAPPARSGRSGRRGRGRKKGRTAASEEPVEALPLEEELGAPEKESDVKLMINVEEPEECRIALIENGRLESYHLDTVSAERTRHNIYKGRIVAIEPNLRAAFVEIGTGRNGFLPFNDVHPEYFRQDLDERSRKMVERQQWKDLRIEDVLSKGQEVLVQVVKEATGNKGANMTTFLSLPGRYIVLMPGSDSSGISRKISSDERRQALREMMADISIPEGIGYIIRTASEEITKTALRQDLSYLLRLWKEIKKRGQTMDAPALVYQDRDIVLRYLRDYFTSDIREIVVDTEDALEQVRGFVEMLPAKQRQVKVKLHRAARPIFNQHNIEEQIESIFKPQVTLPSGGSIVIDPTEALVAIDVNSGRTSRDGGFEETIFQANMEAAAELARQLRLRDLGGLIVVDFIDMRQAKHIREVERMVKLSMKRDKAKVDISRISRFGLMQISRQKLGAPIEKGSYRLCEHCSGRGVVRSVETQAISYLRQIQTGVSRKKTARAVCTLPLDVAEYLLNRKRAEIVELETRNNVVIVIVPDPSMKPGDKNLDFQAERPEA